MLDSYQGMASAMPPQLSFRSRPRKSATQLVLSGPAHTPTLLGRTVKGWATQIRCHRPFETSGRSLFFFSFLAFSSSAINCSWAAM